MTTEQLMQKSPDARLAMSLEEISKTQHIWILTDADGCVFLTSDDEDCVPIWPTTELAEYWATGDWENCNPKSISVDDWFQKWTPGLTIDDVSIAVCPNPDEAGVVMFPDVVEQELLNIINAS